MARRSKRTAPEAPAPADAAPADEGWRDRVETDVKVRVDSLSDRFEEPIAAVTDLTQKTMALWPVRVWRRFLAANGFLLSAGISYQALFAVFAAVYVLFAVAGLWLVGSPDTLHALVSLINTYIPGLIDDGGGTGIISEQDLLSTAGTSTTVLGWTGVIALGSFLWTAIGWMTYSRTAVRSIFGLPKDSRAYLLLKGRDLIASLLFGALLLVGAALSVASSTAIEWLLGLVGISATSGWAALIGQLVGYAVVYAIDAAVLITMFRFLSGAAIPWRRLLGGSLLGAAGLVVLQLGGSFLVGRTTSNPLLATFAVLIGLLLWFRLSAIVTLVAAAIIYINTIDHGDSLRVVTPAQLEAEREIAEHKARLTVTRIEVQRATEALAAANWLSRRGAKRRLAEVNQELDELEAWVPPQVGKKRWMPPVD